MTITLKTKAAAKRNRKLIDKLLRKGYTLRLDKRAESSRFDRR